MSLNLFVYGTLHHPKIQKLLIGRELESEPYSLEDYTVVSCEDDYFTVVEESGSVVNGHMLVVDSADLFIFDQWEDITDYTRVYLLRAGVGFWVYLRKEYKGVMISADPVQVASKPLEEVLVEVKSFVANSLPSSGFFADVYLLYSVKFIERPEAVVPNFNQLMFMKIFESTLSDELNNVQDIQLTYMASNFFNFDVEGKPYLQSFDIYIISNTKLKTSALILHTPMCQVPVDFLFGNAYVHNLLADGVTLKDMFSRKYDVTILTRPKLYVYADKLCSSFMLKKLFGAEYTVGDTDYFNENTFVQNCKTNIANYTSAEIYTSSICVYEFATQFSLEYFNRLKSQSLTLFIITQFLFEQSAITDLGNQLSEIELSGGVNSSDKLYTLSGRYMQIKANFCEDCYIYPTAVKLSESIYNSFQYGVLLDKFDGLYMNISNSLEIEQQYIDKQIVLEDKERDFILNGVVLILSVLCIFSVLTDGQAFIETLDYFLQAEQIIQLKNYIFPRTIVVIYLISIGIFVYTKIKRR